MMLPLVAVTALGETRDLYCAWQMLIVAISVPRVDGMDGAGAATRCQLGLLHLLLQHPRALRTRQFQPISLSA